MYTLSLGEKRLSDDDLDERDSEDEDRQERFIGESSEMFKSKSLNDLKPFYNDTSLKTRKDEIRKSIYYIRHNWGDFDTFLSKLKAWLLESKRLKFKNKKTTQLAERLLTTKRDWLTSETINAVEVTFDAIKLYTSVEGYEAIYGLSNEISRTEDSIAYVDRIRSVVFLGELINIDLHNYCLIHPEKTNFQGMVYRGMTLIESELEAFKSLSTSPIDKREISVPLGLFSSSTSIEVAKRFIKQQIQKSDTTSKVPMLIKTHVIGLKQEYKDIFTSMFPTSVLMTICAVDIHELSLYRREQEVLLKTPFFLVLDMYAEGDILEGKPCDVLEMVMLNDNRDRDHMSTSQLGELDGKARDIFECMATITKSEFAAEYCSEKGLTRDAEEFSKVLAVNKAKLEQIRYQ